MEKQYKKKHWYFNILIVIICFTACNTTEYNSYQKEVKKVLHHYNATPNDSLKLKAAKFLTENIPYHYSYEGEAADLYYKITDSIITYVYGEDPYLQADAFKKHLSPINFNDLITKRDMGNITAEFLISYIDSSFKAFNYPWNKSLNFDDFCEYVLPYRFRKEPFEDWHHTYTTYFSSLIDSLHYINPDSYEACEFLCDHLSKEVDVIGFNLLASLKLDLPASQLLKIKSARCNELTAKAIYSMRACGLPISGDFTPQWGNRSMGHEWNVLCSKDKLVTFQLDEGDIFGEHINKKQEIDKLTKVYRYMFSIQKESLPFMNKKNEEIPPFFQTPFLKDVTAEYIPTTEIEITISKNSLKKKFAYLMVFDNQNWQPVDWGKIRKDKVHFSNIPFDCMYTVMLYDNKNFIPVSNPFYINENKRVVNFEPDENNTQDVTLYRKYPLSASIRHVLEFRMINGEFQVADKADFSDAIVFHTIIDSDGPIKRAIEVSLLRPYRYFRYLGPDSSLVNMAEIEVYTPNNEKLMGEIIGTEGSYKNRRGFDKTTVFDGDILTFFDAPDPINSWVGLDFMEPKQIGKLIYIPRNDDNEVNEGEIYELFYFNKQWISLGKKNGTENQSVEYENIPSNALLWLRNHTKGKEERIFTLENGETRWW